LKEFIAKDIVETVEFVQLIKTNHIHLAPPQLDKCHHLNDQNATA
jgi:hypothetical protein